MVLSALQDEIGLLPEMTYMSIEGLLQVHYDMAMLVVARALPIAFVISVLDYAYQWYQNHEKMMMTHEEIKEEHKTPRVTPTSGQREGTGPRDRECKALGEVRWDVVSPTRRTTPSRFATVPTRLQPRLSCKGVDHFALKIKAEARAHDVPTIENRPLARALYATAKIGDDPRGPLRRRCTGHSGHHEPPSQRERWFCPHSINVRSGAWRCSVSKICAARACARIGVNMSKTTEQIWILAGLASLGCSNTDVSFNTVRSWASPVRKMDTS